MDRIYTKFINKYSHLKITLISGPRQTGKTTTSKMLDSSYEYLSFDSEEDRYILKDKSWDRKKNQIIFDELHKMKNWKSWLKGIFDKESIPPKLTVTGSAKLDILKKVGDSLAGRYFAYRVYPLDIIELALLDKKLDIKTTMDRLDTFSGFPEPYLANDLEFYNKWKKTHLDIILRQDLVDTQNIKDIISIELLVSLLQKRVGSPISYSSLARDLQVSDKTVKNWLQILEDLYIVFKIIPFHKNIARANTKQPKYYFFDNARVIGDIGVKTENQVALSLLKYTHMMQDCLGKDIKLHYVSKNGGIEIDFALVENEKITKLIEVKASEDTPSKNFNPFLNEVVDAEKIQLVRNLSREKTFANGIEVRSLGEWLVKLGEKFS